MKTQDFDFFLPEHLIAQHPAAERTASRLMHVKNLSDDIVDYQFLQLTDLISQNDLIIFNDTQVIKARLFGEKTTGGAVEVMIERAINDTEAYALVRASRSPKIGSRLILAGQYEAEVTGRKEELFQLTFLDCPPIFDILEAHGSLPLPPYIKHSANDQDESRYQTVYAKHAGAVAAPTAGLHFDKKMLNALKEMGVQIAYVTLHVGAGTFQPVKADVITDHKMHSEVYHIPEETIKAIKTCQSNGGKVMAVGTTVMRTLESAAQKGTLTAGRDETNIFITPGFQFKAVDRLLTNFHLPKSTLLMLVSAFAGIENIKRAYQHAVEHEYRFFSYGDAMLLEKQSEI